MGIDVGAVNSTCAYPVKGGIDIVQNEASKRQTASMVVFDAKGLVKLMTVFDFGPLPADKTVVRRFDLPDTGCESVSRILINGAARCKGEGIEASDCAKALKTKNLTDAEFGS